MSKALKNEGFNFVGPTLVCAFMQAVGILDEHSTSCFRYKEIASQSEAFFGICFTFSSGGLQAAERGQGKFAE
jgi:hypothetical protein